MSHETLAQDKTSKSDEEAIAALASPPGVSFSYTVENKILAAAGRSKNVDFIVQDGRYLFKWADLKTGEVIRMYAYDGHRYYSYVGMGYMNVGTTPPLPWSLSWFTESPLYYMPMMVFGYPNSPFCPASFGSDNLIKAKKLFARRKGDAAEVTTPNSTKSCTFSTNYPWPSSVQEVAKIGVRQNSEATSFLTISNTGLTMPGKIVSVTIDPKDGILPSSPTITVDPASVKILKERLDDHVFRIPLSIVKQVYDEDSRVGYKSQNWAY